MLDLLVGFLVVLVSIVYFICKKNEDNTKHTTPERHQMNSNGFPIEEVVQPEPEPEPTTSNSRRSDIDQFPTERRRASFSAPSRRTMTHSEAKADELDDIELGEEQRKVFDLMNNTNENLFITGKAGTGKSVLLQYFVKNTHKEVAIVAPTGVAALNIGGWWTNYTCFFWNGTSPSKYRQKITGGKYGIEKTRDNKWYPNTCNRRGFHGTLRYYGYD